MADQHSGSGASPQAPHGSGSGLAAFVRAHVRPILMVVIPALLIAALSPLSNGLRELMFPTRVSVTGTLELPQGEFANLSVVLDGERRATPDESGPFIFEDVRKGKHSISVDASGLNSRPVAFTVAPGSDDIGLNEITVEPSVRLVGSSTRSHSARP